MRAPTLDDVAAMLPLERRACVVRPEWQNPACEGGAGLQGRVSRTLGHLLHHHRDQLIVATYAAQFLLLSCEGEGDAREAAEELGPMRHESDMIWHTDEIHRVSGSVTAVVGESSVPTGVASKPLIARACARLADEPSEIHAFRKLYLHWLDREREGRSLLFDDAAVNYLFYLYYGTGGRDEEPEWTRGREALWNDVRSINEEEGIVWVGEAQPSERGRTQALFLSRAVYHCKRFTADHAEPRPGAKYRVELKPETPLRRLIDGQLSHRAHDDAPGVDLDRLRAACGQ